MANLAISSEMGKHYVGLAAGVLNSAQKSYHYHGYEVQLTRNENGVVYVNLTEVAKAFPKKNLTQIVNSQEIKEYCESLSKLQNYSLADLLIVKRGGNDNGTWAHQKVALRVAQKLSSEFAVRVDTWIEELLITGSVSVSRTLPQTFAEALRLAADQAERIEQQQKLLAVQNQTIIDLNEANAEMRVKVSYYDQILASKSTVNTTQIAQDYGMSAKKFNIILRNLKIQRKVGGQWILYAPHNTMGYVHSDTFVPENSTTGKVIMNTKWTQKGRLFLYDVLKRNGIYPLIEQ